MVVMVGVLYEADAGDDSFREGSRRAEVQLSSLRDVVIRHCPYDEPIFVAKRGGITKRHFHCQIHVDIGILRRRLPVKIVVW